MTRKIIFHIGVEKTGTSSFQRFCNEHYRSLLDRGILYPVKNLAFSHNNHERLAQSYVPYHDFSAGRGRTPRSAIVQSLQKEIAETAPDAVLISSEHLSSRFREEQIRDLAADFSDYDCQIAVVVKDHLSQLRSAYSQTIASGRSLTLDAYCDEVFDPANRYLRYKDTIGAWEGAFGKGNIRVLSYGRGTDIVQRLCDALIPQAAPRRKAPSYWENKSLGASSTETLRRANAVIYSEKIRKRSEDNYALWLLLRATQGGVRKIIAMAAGDRPHDQLRLSERNLRRLRAITAIDNQWLESRYGIRLSQPGELSDYAGVPAQETADGFAGGRVAGQVGR